MRKYIFLILFISVLKVSAHVDLLIGTGNVLKGGTLKLKMVSEIDK
ncbi:hypothetical protein NF867_13945 [Solitalea sp. MAHUQ-68]|uniref:Uncharacterized protein n=1 Tax=Solitalea agri TaxID=2953739 RepID=A0A9X2JDB8_9SPHI|nr:hypothetical protein [Solitalea agri]MCO4293963.1 hypothetical protein [Solitalea agri]